MLLFTGYPSRSSLINQILLKNSHIVDNCQAITTLFKLTENEDSPFKIAKQGPLAVAEIMQAFPSLSHYEPFIKKTLAVRILQKCKNFYTNIKIKTLEKFLAFYGSTTDIETLIYHCNRAGLINTILDHKTNVITFD